MDILTICGFGILAVAVCAVLRHIKPESAIGVSIAAGIFIMGAAIAALKPSVEAIKTLSDGAGLGEFSSILFKALAVCYITTLSADLARDAGEAALGGKLELAGRVAVAAISLPVFTSLAELVTGLIG